MHASRHVLKKEKCANYLGQSYIGHNYVGRLLMHASRRVLSKMTSVSRCALGVGYVMVYIVMAHTVMVYIVMAHIVMALGVVLRWAGRAAWA